MCSVAKPQFSLGLPGYTRILGGQANSRLESLTG